MHVHSVPCTANSGGALCQLGACPLLIFACFTQLRYGKWALDFIFFVFCAGGKTRQPFLPPACRTILKGSCIVCVFCAPRSGTRVWTCSLISGLLCIFSLLKKQHITSAAPMMIVSFSPSTHLVRAMYVPSPHIKTVLYCACNFAHLAQGCSPSVYLRRLPLMSSI